ncbi:acyltransferase family protein [Saccharopolyspora griseoalba]|uniref:Acyltransferase family protein n=1 Tax=Saccharopolyspora griseoalba TaxID=1431848 RepID=A0ABW2LPH8_9PSEU
MLVGAARVEHARPELFADPAHGFAWIRMIGALLVIYGHSSPLSGHGDLFPAWWPVQPDEGVLMGFFAMSGFQITESWMRDPHPGRFAAKRVLRLWPPMLTVSVGMALIVGPLVSDLPVGEYFAAHGTWAYIVDNAGLVTLQHELPGVFADNPWPDAVNGSLWTLPMELLAYAGLFVLLVAGTAKRERRWLAVVALVALVIWDRHLEQTPGAESAGSLLSVPVESLVAFLVAFALGVVLNLYRVPLSPLAAAAGLVVLALMPNSIAASFLMAFAVSYAVVVAGHFWPERLTVPGVWVNGSYGVYVWGFPTQQLLAMAGIRNEWIMLVCAAPIAYVLGTLSWKFVEDPTMKLRHLLTPAPEREPEPLADPDSEVTRQHDAVPPEPTRPEPARAEPPRRPRPEPPRAEPPPRPEPARAEPPRVEPPRAGPQARQDAVWRPPPRPAPQPPGHRQPPRPPTAAEDSPLARRLSGEVEGAPRPPRPGPGETRQVRPRGADPNRRDLR